MLLSSPTVMLNDLKLKWDNVNKSIYTSLANINRNTLFFVLLFLTSSFLVSFCLYSCVAFVQGQPSEAKSLTYAWIKEFWFFYHYSEFQSFWPQKQNLEFTITHTHPSDCSRNYICIQLAFYIGLFRDWITLFSYIKLIIGK